MKPMGKRCYGTIPHLPGSRKSRGDIDADNNLVRWCTEEAPAHSRLWVQEKLDGSNVGVWHSPDGEIVPLIRAGHRASEAHYPFLREFHDWAMEREKLWRDILFPGERICGEWLVQAHGTIYNLPHGPFVAFDIMVGDNRLKVDEFSERTLGAIPIAATLFYAEGAAIPLAEVEAATERSRHGAVGPAEGAVYRLERFRSSSGKPMYHQFLAKWVRPDKQDGSYLPEVTGGEAIRNRWTDH